ncbi:MAG: tRNA uridine-5-carboxymethylaminomethyl(34) synthesis GTPase MnmE [Actinobacteria bacterium]|nr:tRNA uridine-5-carboxymethylaminomethyl(34) synthesis GTPase MnmE [Actinomycetota bacterium]
MDTIVAISSPPGVGAVAVVRLSGPEAFKIGASISGLCLSKIKFRYAYYRMLKSLKNNEIDDAIVIFYKGPESYTGEDTVEFFCHSSPAVLTMLIDECISQGARPAEPGEFTKRAFLNGKMDLIQVEAVADIIDSVSPHSLEAALNLRKGILSGIIKNIREKILFLVSEFEAEIDFEEEEMLDMTAYEDRKVLINELISEIQKLIRSASNGIKIREGIKVALVGVPNVGKSSLMNALSKRERAIVTPEPGTTRDLIEEKIILKGLTIILTDTAGIRRAQSMAEEEGVKRSKMAIEEADIVLFVLDASRDLLDEEIQIMKEIPLEKCIFVINKMDIHKKHFVEKIYHMLSKLDSKEIKVFEVSAKDGRGLDELSEAMVKKVFAEGLPAKESILVTNRRHLYHLERAEKILNESLDSLDNANIELTAFLLREASLELSKIIGLVTHDEIMTEIFSRFCIGK